jgi:hypothetical protein
MYSYLSKLFLHKITPFGSVLRIFIETHNSEAKNRLTHMYEKTTRIFFIYLLSRTNAGATSRISSPLALAATVF